MTMKKLISLFLTLIFACSLTALVSCGEVPDPVDPVPKDEPTEPQAKVQTYVMVVPDSMDSYQQQYAVAIRRLLTSALDGELQYTKSSAYRGEDYENPFVFAFGKTGLAEFAECEESMPTDPDIASYLVRVSDKNACFIANHTLSLSAMLEFINDIYIENDKFLKVEHGVKTNMANISISEYYEEIENTKIQAYREKYANRWTEAEQTLSAETVTELKNFYSQFGDSLIELIANLYDPDTGAFYYALSAKKYNGYLPDVESTYQILAFLTSSGLTAYYGDDLTAFFDTEMRTRLANWVKGLQDPDGYFYHPQWGKDIKTNRKNRDLNWATGILSKLGQKSVYPTPSDRLSDLDLVQAGSVPALLASGATGTDGLPEYLLSEEAFIAYLDSFGGVNRSMGNTLSPMKGQIKAAGLLDVCLDYILAAEREDNGLFQESADYNAMGALYKLGGTVTSGKRAMRYVDKKIGSCMQVILSEVTPSTIVDVYNPWAALAGVFKNMIATGTDATPYYEIVRAHAPELLRATLKKLQVFYKPDGGCSYYPNCSANYTQGTPVCVGLAESDVNATVIGVSNILTAIFETLNVEKVTMYGVEDAQKLIGLLKNSERTVKVPYVNEETETFDGEQIPSSLVAAMSSSGKISLAVDPKDANNGVLQLETSAGSGDVITFTAAHLPMDLKCYTFRGDFMIRSGFNSSAALQISLRGGTVSYMFDIVVSGTNVTFRDRASEANTKKSNTVAWTATVDEWIRLEIEYYTSGNAKVFINGHCVLVSDNFFGSDTEGALPNNEVNDVSLRAYKGADGVILMDNLQGVASAEKTFVSEPIYVPDPEVKETKQDFENVEVGKLGDLISKGKSATEAGVTEQDGNKALTFRTVAEVGDGITWNCGEYGEISFDITVAENSGAKYAYQIKLGKSTVAYMLDLVVEGSTVILKDNPTTSNTDHAVALGSFALGEKANIKVQYAGGTATVFVNGEKIAESNNYFGAESSNVPVAKANGILFWAMKKAEGTIVLDNLCCK